MSNESALQAYLKDQEEREKKQQAMIKPAVENFKAASLLSSEFFAEHFDEHLDTFEPADNPLLKIVHKLLSAPPSEGDLEALAEARIAFSEYLVTMACDYFTLYPSDLELYSNEH